MICFCGRPALAHGLCRPHYGRAYAEARRRQQDTARALVIHAGRPGLIVAAPDADLLNALLTVAAHRAVPHAA